MATTRSFDDLVASQAAAMQGSAAGLVDVSVGSILRAFSESNGQVALWLQALILQLLATTRASTAKGLDLDSWVGDFGVTRLPAVSSTGAVTFSRFTPGLTASVPAGATVTTSDGSLQFGVIASTSAPGYDAGTRAYVLPPGASSLTIPVRCTTPGASGNIAPGAANTLTQAMPGIDTVTNAGAFQNGKDAESDAALRVRFQAYIASRSLGTPAAVRYAVSSVQQGLDYQLVENEGYDGTFTPGYFYVVLDDGSGSPPTSLISAVYAAIEAVRGFTGGFGVFGPQRVDVSIAQTVTVAAGFDGPTVRAQAQAALTNYVSGLRIGSAIPYTRLSQVDYDASPGVINVSGVTLNGGTTDLQASKVQKFHVASVVVS